MSRCQRASSLRAPELEGCHIPRSWVKFAQIGPFGKAVLFTFAVISKPDRSVLNATQKLVMIRLQSKHN